MCVQRDPSEELSSQQACTSSNSIWSLFSSSPAFSLRHSSTPPLSLFSTPHLLSPPLLTPPLSLLHSPTFSPPLPHFLSPPLPHFLSSTPHSPTFSPPLPHFLSPPLLHSTPAVSLFHFPTPPSPPSGLFNVEVCPRMTLSPSPLHPHAPRSRATTTPTSSHRTTLPPPTPPPRPPSTRFNACRHPPTTSCTATHSPTPTLSPRFPYRLLAPLR